MKKPVTLFLVAACAFILINALYVFAEEKITLTTYYPAPYGVYRELRVNQMAIGSNYRNTSLSDGTLIVSDKLDVGGDFMVSGIKPVLIKRFKNVAKDTSFNTGISAEDYYCWDGKWVISEQSPSVSLIFTYVKDGKWWVSTDWLHHKKDQDWEILCFRKEMSQWQSGLAATGESE